MKPLYRNIGIATLVAGALALGGCEKNEPKETETEAIVGKATYNQYRNTLSIAATDGKQYEVGLRFGVFTQKPSPSEDLFNRAIKGATSADETFLVTVRDPREIACIDAFCEATAYAQNVSFSPAENPNVSR